MHPLAAALTAGIASALEFVEAATIVLAVGVTAGWRVALRAAGLAVLVLVVICSIFGPALVIYVPLGILQTVIGLFLLLFGFTWLRKAIWRYSGRKAMRDETSAFGKEVEALAKQERQLAFATAFNGVLLEGLEVAVIVITFAAASVRTMVWAAAGALVAGVIVAIAAALLRHPFSRVPENAMGFLVGVMLLSFGTFWSGEGLGIAWPWHEATIAYFVAAYVVTALLAIAVNRPRGVRA